MRRLAEAIRAGQVARVRYAAPDRVPHVVREAAAEALQYVADTPVSLHGRVELLWYFREQSISHVYHRYGNLGIRAEEPRRRAGVMHSSGNAEASTSSATSMQRTLSRDPTQATAADVIVAGIESLQPAATATARARRHRHDRSSRRVEVVVDRNVKRLPTSR